MSDRRFVLVTDIGLLVKKNADGSSDVFVLSIKAGATRRRRRANPGQSSVPLVSGWQSTAGSTSPR